MAWQHLDQQHPQDCSLWLERSWVTGDRQSSFLTFALGTDLRMRVYDAGSGHLLAESPTNRARKPKPATKTWRT